MLTYYTTLVESFCGLRKCFEGSTRNVRKISPGVYPEPRRRGRNDNSPYFAAFASPDPSFRRKPESRGGPGQALREIFRFFGCDSAELALGGQELAADFDRFGVDQDESDHTRLSAAIDPIVDRAALHKHVARF